MRDGNRDDLLMEPSHPKGLKAGVPVCGMETALHVAQQGYPHRLKAGVPVCGMETT